VKPEHFIEALIFAAIVAPVVKLLIWSRDYRRAYFAERRKSSQKPGDPEK